MNKIYFIDKVRFETIEEYIAIRKIQPGFSLSKVLEIHKDNVEQNPNLVDVFTKPEAFAHFWETIPAMTEEQARAKYQKKSEQLELCLSFLSSPQ